MNRIFLLVVSLLCLIACSENGDYKVGSASCSIEPDDSIFSLTLGGYGYPAEGRFCLEWKRIGKVGTDYFKEVTTIDNGREYRLDEDSSVWMRLLDGPQDFWIKLAYRNGWTCDVDIDKISVVEGRLYALDKDGVLYVNHNRSKGNLSARAVAISSGDECALIIGADLIGFNSDFTDKVKEEITLRTGIPADHIVINASHTHFGPQAQTLKSWVEFCRYPDPRFLEDCVKPGMVEAALKALKNRKSCDLYFSRAETHIGGNRCLSWERAIVDPTLDVITSRRNGKIRDLVFTTACHAVFNNDGFSMFTLSGNFPAEAKRLISEELGVKSPVFLQGCAGDINPVDGDPDFSGLKLARDVVKALDSDATRISGPISFRTDTVRMPVHIWPEEQIAQFREDHLPYVGDLEAEKNVRWCDNALKSIHDGTVPETMDILLQIVNIGDWKLVCLSREPVCEYAIRIRELFPGENVSVVGYCSDVSSYIPAPSHIIEQTYEGYNSFFWYGEPDRFPMNTLETVLQTVGKE
ncbi:MAG: hypothetical protein MJY70_02710 [Bacteroidales bacterium]|nr:hypothetical protein [Bacteroidales bacterium]